MEEEVKGNEPPSPNKAPPSIQIHKSRGLKFSQNQILKMEMAL